MSEEVEVSVDATDIEDVNEAKRYLETGALGEVIGLAHMAMEAKQPKVLLDTDMAIALCLLANEALNRRRAH